MAEVVTKKDLAKALTPVIVGLGVKLVIVAIFRRALLKAIQEQQTKVES